MKTTIFVVLTILVFAALAEQELTWQPPTTNVDGSTLEDLDGFIVSAFVGEDRTDTFTKETKMPISPAVMTRYYVVAVDKAGNKSAPSNAVMAGPIDLPPSDPVGLTVNAGSITVEQVTVNGGVTIK